MTMNNLKNRLLEKYSKRRLRANEIKIAYDKIIKLLEQLIDYIIVTTPIANEKISLIKISTNRWDLSIGPKNISITNTDKGILWLYGRDFERLEELSNYYIDKFIDQVLDKLAELQIQRELERNGL